MTDLVRTLLTLRGRVPDRVLLDCLELDEHLGQRIQAGQACLVTTAYLSTRWHCDQSTVSRRMQALRVHQLIDASLHPGRGAHWEVHRVGPVA